MSRYRRGESAARIAREYGVNPAWLSFKLDEWGIRRDRHRRRSAREP
ncbi:hypothetical protein [Streptomyces phytohabitans]